MDRILEELHVAVVLARVERDRRDRSDPAGRMISLAITDMESAENWLERAQRSDREEAHTENPA